jgi:rod shape determining protein RodA
MRESRGWFGKIDWIAVLLYAGLVLFGWLNIYAAVFNEEFGNIWDTSQEYGKQLIFIGAGLVLILVVLLSDARLYELLAIPIYLITLALLALVLVAGKEVGGNKSWLVLGGFTLQPSELAKFGTSLVLSWYLAFKNVDVAQWRYRWMPLLLLALPMILILAQPDTGSALVFFSFALVLYRAGLPMYYLLLGLWAIVLVVVTLLFDALNVSIGLTVLALTVLMLLRRQRKIALPIFIGLGLSLALTLGTGFFFNQILQPHQQMRVNLLLGKVEDSRAAGYQTAQSLIAIGSGGFSGKGFLQGTQTKFNFVPAQSTDYIFCTVGEEWGFLGSVTVLLAFLGLLYRLVFLAERQKSPFARYYGYCVVSILFFHLVVNIGMTLGIMPVIGIPLPFFSYGGSSLWGFTLLLFVFIKLDAQRWQEL